MNSTFSRSRALIVLFFPALMLLPVVVNTVSEIESTQMSLSAGAVALLVGLILGALLVVLRYMSANPLFRILFLLGIAAVIGVYLDVLLFSYHDVIRARVDALGDFFGFIDGARPLGGLILFACFVLVIFAIFAAVIWYFGVLSMIWVHSDQIIDVFAILFAVSSLSTIVLASNDSSLDGPRNERISMDQTNELSITIVLDGMTGSGGLRSGMAQNAKLADEIDAFFQEYGFVHYPKAFSRHFYTLSSIPAVLNGLSTGIPDLSEVSNRTGYHNRMTENAFFDSLQDKNLPVHVYQTQYVDVCTHEAVVSCTTVNTADRLSRFIPEKFKVQSKFFLSLYMIEYALNSSYVAGDVVKVLFYPFFQAFRATAPDQYRLLFGYIMNADLTFESMFDQFVADISTRDGGAFYGHFMPTHYPFRLNAQCEVVLDRFAFTGEQAFSRLVEAHGNTAEEAERKRADFYADYRDHARCSHRKLSMLFDELKRQNRYDDARIVVFGDHGSRISNGSRADTTSESDLVDNHSALFAIKEPFGYADTDTRMIPVQQLLMAHQAQDVEAALTDVDRTLVLDIEHRFNAEKTLTRMPDF